MKELHYNKYFVKLKGFEGEVHARNKKEAVILVQVRALRHGADDKLIKVERLH